MAGKQLKAEIILGGKADGSFLGLVNQIEQFGTKVNALSQKLIDFGKESLTTYADYEDEMLDMKGALASVYSDNELETVYEKLTAAGMQWAKDSRFTTLDVAQAMATAAHSGWDLEKIMQGVPEAMDIALAGGMDLSASLEYLVDIANAAGLEFDSLDGFTDMWAYTANHASTDVEEMGMAMQAMGGSLQFFKGDMGELTVMLDMLANNGIKGSQAGTHLRNALVRLIAPTQKAAEEMEELDLSGEELSEIYDDPEALEAASKKLAEFGFTAYDAQGSLKPFTTTFEELNGALDQMTEEDRNKVIASIFPTRTMSDALALLGAAGNDWSGLLESVYTDSGDYAEKTGEIMESGIGGALRHLESEWNVFQTQYGSSISEFAGNIAGSLSKILDFVNGMGDAGFAALASGTETLAAAGPALLGITGGIKAVTAIAGMSTVGKIVMLTTAVGALGAAAKSFIDVRLQERFEGMFGGMDVDSEALLKPINDAIAAFQSGYTEVDAFAAALATATANYETASSTFSNSLLTDMITGATLTEADKTSIHELAHTMYTEVLTGIQQSMNASESYLEMLFGGESAFSNPDFGDAAYLMSLVQGDLISQAQSIGNQMGEAIGSAMDDGIITGDEYSVIMEKMRAYNEALGAVNQAELEGDMALQLDKAQSVSWDSYEGYLADAQGGMESALATERENYIRQRAQMAYYYKYANEHGIINPETGEVYTVEGEGNDLDTFLAGYDVQYQGRVDYIKSQYGQQVQTVMDTLLGGSDMGDAWNLYKDIMAQNPLMNEHGLSDMANIDWKSLVSEGDVVNMAAQLETLSRNWGKISGVIEPFLSGTGLEEFAGTEYSLGVIQRMLRGSYSVGMPNITAPFENTYTNLEPGVVSQGIVPADQVMEIALSANDSDLQAQIQAQDGQWIDVNVGANTDAAKSAIDALGNRSVTVRVVTRPAGGTIGALNGFAEGGRADEPSIFGEGSSAEWAIPEEHSERTAELLANAARASGFTWDELLSRNGGLNAGGGSTRTLVYSPTINASDARDVEDKLIADKERLDRWYRDRAMRDEVEAYA